MVFAGINKGLMLKMSAVFFLQKNNKISPKMLSLERKDDRPDQKEFRISACEKIIIAAITTNNH